MWSRWLRLLLWGLLSLVASQTTVPNCKTLRKPRVFPSPSLSSNTSTVTLGDDVSLSCSHKNTSLEITYSLFLLKKHVKTKKGRGEPVVFNIKISTANDLGPYKCKAEFSNCTTYSQEFNFKVVETDSCPLCLLPVLLPGLLMLLAIILILVYLIPQKCKAKKAERENMPEDCGGVPGEETLYENIHKGKEETGSCQEIHYAAPVLQETEGEGCRDCETGYVYSELNLYVN